MNCFSPIQFGRQRRKASAILPRHRHKGSYVALVLSGGYEEAGDRGRYRVRPGDVVVHGSFEAHMNRYDPSASEVLNVPLPAALEPCSPRVTVSDFDLAVRLAESDLREAAAFLSADMQPSKTPILDWPDKLAADLYINFNLRLETWASEHHLASATVSRGFFRVFGVTPSAYRAQLRARLAWRRIIERRDSLTSVALDFGFADQSHMTRSVRAITGRTPGWWRGPGEIAQVK
jgi:AraC-like DNA-binding protein